MNEATSAYTHVPAALVQKIDDYAAEQGINRPSAIRLLLEKLTGSQSLSPLNTGVKRSRKRGITATSKAGDRMPAAGEHEQLRRVVGSLPGPMNSGGGRPTTMEGGTNISARLPRALLEDIDRRAASENMTRSKKIWKMLEQALSQPTD